MGRILNSLFGLCLLAFLSFVQTSDQISEGSQQVSKVTCCVRILKWQRRRRKRPRVGYRAARAGFLPKHFGVIFNCDKKIIADFKMMVTMVA